MMAYLHSIPYFTHFSIVFWHLASYVLYVLPLSIAYICVMYIQRRNQISKSISSLQHRFYDVFADTKYLKFYKSSPNKNATNNFLQVACGVNEIFKEDKLCCFWLSFVPFILCSKAEIVEEILSSTKLTEKGWLYQFLHPWLGTGILTSHGNKWKFHRKLLTPAFHFDILKDFLPVINEKSQILMQKLRKETEMPWVDVTKFFSLCTLDIVCETTMGVNMNIQENSATEYVQAILSVTEKIMERILSVDKWLDFIYYMTPAGRKLKKDLKILENFHINVIEDRKKKFLREGIVKGKRKALMDILVEHHIKDKSLSEKDIREEVSTFTFAGHDTTAMSLCWAIYLIGLYKDVQQKMHDELDDIFGDDGDRPITNDDLKRMDYLERVLKESQRIYPVVSMLGRNVSYDTKIGGYNIPKGAIVVIFPYQLHRNQDVFPNPEVFDPDRFLPENTFNRHPYAYIPFSAGPRNCIGQRFAMMEMKILIADLLRNYEVESLTPRDKIKLSLDIVLRPAESLKIKLTPRI